VYHFTFVHKLKLPQHILTICIRVEVSNTKMQLQLKPSRGSSLILLIVLLGTAVITQYLLFF